MIVRHPTVLLMSPTMLRLMNTKSRYANSYVKRPWEVAVVGPAVPPDHDTDRPPAARRPRLVPLAFYAIVVGVAATGFGLLLRRALAPGDGAGADSGLILAVVLAGLLGGIAGERSHWFDRR
jgi:hypothetical protein